MMMEPDPDRQGEIIAGRFELQVKIGDGSYGVVWRARDVLNPARRVAVKLLRAQHAKNPLIMERFVREAQILVGLKHPNIAAAVAWGPPPDNAFIVLEFIDGTSLHEILWRRSDAGAPFDVEDLERIWTNLFRGLQYAHECAILHRDLKPSNIMLTSGSNDVKILDFGVAKLLDASSGEETTQGRRLGSVAYMAPEQARCGELDVRVDVFAAGVILFEMATLHRPWYRCTSDRPVPIARIRDLNRAHNSSVDILGRITAGRPPSACRIRPELPAALDAVLQRSMAADRRERFPTVEELERAVMEALRDPRPWAPATLIESDESALTDVAPQALDPSPGETPLRLSPTGTGPTMLEPRPLHEGTEVVRARVTQTRARAQTTDSEPPETRLIEPTHILSTTHILSRSGLRSAAPWIIGLWAALGILIAVLQLDSSEPQASEPDAGRPQIVQGAPSPGATPLAVRSPGRTAVRRSAPRRKVVAKADPKPAPVDEPPSKPTHPLRRMLSALESNAQHTASDRLALASRLKAAAVDLPNAEDRTSVERCATQVFIQSEDGSLTLLESCVVRFEQATR